MTRGGSAAAAAFAILAAGAATPAAAQVVAVIAFREARVDAVDGAVRGPQRSITVTLQGGSRISDRDERRAPGGGQGWRGGWGRVTSNEGNFRDEFSPTGLGARGSWRVGPNNTLVRTTRFRTYVETVTLSVRGGSSCEARVAYARNRGAPLFSNAAGDWRDIRAEGVSCAISDRG